LPPPASDPADPYRKRAEAVGLHPDLSRVLLDRLSPADYRNAAYAVETALAKTPDTAVFVWPRQRKPEQALFQVRFVQGAAPACRRYVVTITKDGWLTTALPMERCGAPAGRSARRE
jgi:surface antigen